jgi:hypothetical protein
MDKTIVLWYPLWAANQRALVLDKELQFRMIPLPIRMNYLRSLPHAAPPVLGRGNETGMWN